MARVPRSLSSRTGPVPPLPRLTWSCSLGSFCFDWFPPVPFLRRMHARKSLRKACGEDGPLGRFIVLCPV
eukprot:5588967-Lingulodinium_polyedra.AAC.1